MCAYTLEKGEEKNTRVRSFLRLLVGQHNTTQEGSTTSSATISMCSPMLVVICAWKERASSIEKKKKWKGERGKSIFRRPLMNLAEQGERRGE